MPGHDIIVIGASAGGVEALVALARQLPRDLGAAVFVAVHIPASAPSVLPRLLERASGLPAVHPVDGARIERGHIYVAPPDLHLLLRRGRVVAVPGPRENGHRPAIDPLFRSAAIAYGARVVGVVLSGNLDDGTAGLQAIKERGGMAVVQDPAEALYKGMPASAVENVAVDHVLPLAEIAPMLARLASTSADEGAQSVSDDMQYEEDSVELQSHEASEPDRRSAPSGFTCPECHGSLFVMQDDALERYRCRVGHAYSAGSLLGDQVKSLEAALWMALRALEENGALLDRIIARARRDGNLATMRRFEAQTRLVEQHAETIRNVLRNGPLGTLAEHDADDAPWADERLGRGSAGA